MMEFAITDKSCTIHAKKPRKSRESWQMRQRRRMMDVLVQHMTDYLCGTLQNCAHVCAIPRKHIAIDELLNSDDDYEWEDVL